MPKFRTDRRTTVEDVGYLTIKPLPPDGLKNFDDCGGSNLGGVD